MKRKNRQKLSEVPISVRLREGMVTLLLNACFFILVAFMLLFFLKS
ncbi:hypothetical protein [Peribacillus sp. SCS-37]